MASPLAALFKLRPDRAADYLLAKGLRLTGPYWELDGPAHSHLFTVANLAKLDVLADIKGAVQQALDSGETERWFKERLVGVLQQKGWWGPSVSVDPDTLEAKILQQGSLRRLQTIYRTNLQTAYMAGRHRQALEQIDRAPWAQYLAIRDQRSRPAHAALHGQVFRIDSPAWSVIAPSNGYNSVLPWQRVSGRTFVGLKAWYTGPAVEVVGKSGSRLSVTAQHPVLTVSGWVAAGDLRQGDQLVAYRADGGGGAVPADLDKNDLPPTVEEVFKSLSLGGRCSMPRAAVNLYGDAVFLQGDVDVVTSDRQLLRHFDAVRHEFLEKISLHGADQAEIHLPSDGALVQVLGGQCDGSASLGRPRSLGVRAEPIYDCQVPVDGDAGLSQLAGDALGACAESPSDLLDPDAGLVQGNRLRWQAAFEMSHIPRGELGSGQFVGFRHGALGHSPLADVFIGGLDVNPSAHRDIMETQAGLIEFDEVVDLRRFEYAGHVYDLETATGCIIAFGGIKTNHPIISNCRCRARYLSDRELANRGLKPAEDVRILEREPPGNRPVDPLTGETPARWLQRGVSIPDPLKPGERLTLWADPNWDHIPGSNGAERLLVDQVMAKATLLSNGIKEAVQAELRRNGAGVAGVRALTDSLRQFAIGSKGTLSERIAILDAKTGDLLADYAQELELDASGDMSTWAHKLKQGSGFSNADMFDADGNMRANNSVLHMHTHPVDHTFSDGDWRVFTRDTIDEMRVVTPAAEYRLKKTPSFNDLPWQSRTPKAIDDEYQKIIDGIFDENPEATINSMIEEASRRLALRLGLDYQKILF
jgi:SPP1 gp7 family putative phage head morphogenesis protein